MNSLINLDQHVGNAFASHRTPVGIAIMRDITALGGHTVLTMIVLFTIGFLVAVRRRRTAAFVLLAVLGGIFFTEALKFLTGRPRPFLEDDELIAFRPDSPSFPSGHSALSAVVYLTIALLVAGRLEGRRIHVYLISWSLILAFLVGVSRLYLGVHYFTDVVAGWAGGFLWAIACRWVEDHWLAVRERSVAVDEGVEAYSG
jgi:undecaprenyl-diphosphatase